MSRLTFILSITALFLFQCSYEPVGISDSANDQQNEEQGEILFKLNMTGAPEEVVGLKGNLSRDKHDTISFAFEIKDGYATARVKNLIAGIWQLQVDAINADGLVIYSGNTSVQVLPGVITPVSLHLNPTTGGLEITVTWGGNYFQDSLLVAYYPFENSLDDLSKYQNQGMDHGGVSYAAGVQGQAVQFDGFDDFIEMSHADYLNMEEKTVTFWFYKTNDFILDTPGWDDVEGLVFKSWDTGLNRDFSFSIGKQKPPFSINGTVWDGTDSLTVLKIYDIIYPKEWYFVTLVTGKEETKLYLNAELIYTASHHNLRQNDAPIILGKCSYKSISTRFFNGRIDEFAIINKTLNSDEISIIYKYLLN